jgi:thioredoxin-like negative regulator of GroEL
MKIITIENKNELLAAKYEHDNIIFLIYGDTCKPCQDLKPKLFEFLKDNDSAELEFTLVMANYKSSKEINKYFGLKKIPFLVFCREADIKGSIQSSKMELILPELNKAFESEFKTEYKVTEKGGGSKDEALDFTGDFDF